MVLVIPVNENSDQLIEGEIDDGEHALAGPAQSRIRELLGA